MKGIPSGTEGLSGDQVLNAACLFVFASFPMSVLCTSF